VATRPRGNSHRSCLRRRPRPDGRQRGRPRTCSPGQPAERGSGGSRRPLAGATESDRADDLAVREHDVSWLVAAAENSGVPEIGDRCRWPEVVCREVVRSHR